MNINIKKENVKRYVAAAALACLVGTPVGLAIGCKKTDHTKELCPITKVLNMLPDYKNDELNYTIPRGAKHQLNGLANDFYSEKFLEQSDKDEEKVIIGSTYGQITHTEEFHVLYEDGTEKIYTNEDFAGEYGITTYYNDGTKDSLVFEETEEPEYCPDFQLQKVVKHTR